MFTLKRAVPRRLASKSTVASVAPAQTQKRDFNEVANFVDSRRPLVKNELLETDWVVHMIEKKSGDDIDHNWSLAKLQINPYYDAFRNTSLEDLLPRVYGTVDKNTKAVHVDAYPTEKFDKFVTQKAQSDAVWANDAVDLEGKFYRRTHKELSYYMTYVPESFVHDGDIGSHTASNTSTRVITDNAVSALFLRNMILPIKVGDSFKYEYDTYVVHAPGYRFTPDHIVEEFGGPGIDDLGLKREEFIVVNDSGKDVLIGAISDSAMLMETVSYVATKNSFEKAQSVYVASESIVNKDGQVTLLLNGNRAEHLMAASNVTLYGAHHNIWSQDGLSRAWSGVSIETDAKEASKAGEGELVEKLGNGKVRLTRNQKTALPNLLKHPKNVAFMVHDPSFQLPALTRVKDIQSAVNLYVSGLTSIAEGKAEFKPAFHGDHLPSAVNPKRLGAALEQILSANVPHIYIINTAMSNKTVDGAVELVQTGQAAEIKAEEMTGSDGAWFNIKHTTLEDKAPKDIAKLVAQIKSKVDSIPEPLALVEEAAVEESQKAE